jgi:DNA-binding response OmpR family regulator
LARPKSKILVVSHDPRLADVRKTVLETAGFAVVPIPASDVGTLKQACKEHEVGLIMIGYSLPPADKRRVWATAREFCKVPILELFRSGKPELLEQNVFSHEALEADDFLKSVQRLLKSTN